MPWSTPRAATSAATRPRSSGPSPCWSSLPGGEGRLQGDSRQRAIPPVDGDPAALADALRAFARQGIDHVQLVLDPITRDSIEAVAGALVDLDDDGV